VRLPTTDPAGGSPYAPGATSKARSVAGRADGLGERVGAISGEGAQVMRVSGDPAAAAARLNRSSAVLYAEPNVLLRASAIPNDARFGELWGLNNTGQSAAAPTPTSARPRAGTRAASAASRPAAA
jgi:Fervidolysin N-terminal prodomain